mgnify:CR=1 FL=1
MRSPDIRVYNIAVPRVTAENTYGYLGVPFGNFKSPTIEPILTRALTDLCSFLGSGLRPSQIVNAHKTFVHSQLPFALRSRVINTSVLDRQTRNAADNTHQLQQAGSISSFASSLSGVIFEG